MSIYTIVWLAAMIVFLIVEAATVGLVSVWFAAGSLAALIASVLHGPVWLQGLLFVLVSAVLLILLKPLSKKILIPKTERLNADRVIGREAVVIERICPLSSSGQVRVSGDSVWSARSESGEEIPEGTDVEVLRIEGVKVIVRPTQSK